MIERAMTITDEAVEAGARGAFAAVFAPDARPSRQRKAPMTVEEARALALQQARMVLEAAAPLLRQPRRAAHPPVERVLFAEDNLPVSRKSLRWLADAALVNGADWNDAPGVFRRLKKRALVDEVHWTIDNAATVRAVATAAGRALLAMLERRT